MFQILYTKLIVLVVLILTTSSFAADRIVIIDKPIVDIIKSAKDRFDDDSALDFDLDNLPKEIFKYDTEVSTYFRPKHHYYKFEAKLLEPVNRLNYIEKRLEVFGQGNQTTLKSTIYIDFGRQHKFPFRWIDRVRDSIVSKIEEKLLDIEFQKILGD